MTTETNAEWLEEIEEQYKWGVSQSLACRNLSDSDIERLIQEAKRVPVLQQKILKNQREKVWELQKENARLREALESILTESPFEDVHRQLERIVETANQALAGVTNGSEA